MHKTHRRKEAEGTVAKAVEIGKNVVTVLGKLSLSQGKLEETKGNDVENNTKWRTRVNMLEEECNILEKTKSKKKQNCYNKKCFFKKNENKKMSRSGYVEQDIRFGFCR